MELIKISCFTSIQRHVEVAVHVYASTNKIMWETWIFLNIFHLLNTLHLTDREVVKKMVEIPLLQT